VTLVLNGETAERLKVAAKERGADVEKLLEQLVREGLERLPSHLEQITTPSIEAAPLFGTNDQATADVMTDPPTTPVAEPFKRVAGLTKGTFTYIADDFDAELPDSFWLGEE